MSDKSSKFGFGLVLGTIIGGISALFLTPKTGKENREFVKEKYEELKIMMEKGELKEKIHEIFGEVTDEGKKMYEQVQKDISARLESFKGEIEDFDKEKYITMVKQAVEKVQKDFPITPEKAEKLQESFINNWNHMLKSLEIKKEKVKSKV
ncbi:MAG: hypothetical protein WCO06_06650 [Candidatus Roizmanbacteria bacterium]